MVRLSTAGLPEWLDACRRAGLEMRRSGRDWCGPCPVCQTGDDRFAIRAGEKRPVIVNARCGHTWLELMRALNPDTGSGGEVARTAAACRRDAPRSRRAADPRQLPQARNARRMLARAHRGRPHLLPQALPRRRRARLDPRRDDMARAPAHRAQRTTPARARRPPVHPRGRERAASRRTPRPAASSPCHDGQPQDPSCSPRASRAQWPCPRPSRTRPSESSPA